MTSNAFVSRAKRTLAAVFATGTLFAGSCSSDGLRAVVAGIDAVTTSLDTSISGRDLSFGEWLLIGLDN